MSQPRLLLVDDDPAILRMLRWSFESYEVVTAGDRSDAVQKVTECRPAVVTLDLGLPPAPDDATEGLQALQEILGVSPQTKVIVVTGNDDRQNAVRAVGLGAYDFYQKPIEPDTLALAVERAFRLSSLEAENRRLSRVVDNGRIGITTASEAMLKLCRTIEKVAPTDATVLLLGESGTGKELLARAMHNLSPRHAGPFVVINCGAIPENLLESELFGHEKGAFTGALRQVKGKVELADGGTLFLDEIGDMPLPLQVKLLRFLQERVIERVGGRTSIPVDIRIVSATNQNLQEQIAREQFREDLYYRISQISIDIPPLRARDDDAVLLARQFADRLAAENGVGRLNLSPEAVAAIRAHGWPGNVRELENRMKRAAILAENGMIAAEDLDLKSAAGEPEVLTLREARDRAEISSLIKALNAADGNISVAAKTLGISRPTVYALMKQHNVKWPP